MASPGNSPAHTLQGASRTTGGLLRGHALGNTANLADFHDIEPISFMPVQPAPGRVRVYQSRDATKPAMTLRHEVTSTLHPVLSTLAGRYSPVRSKYFFFFKYQHQIPTSIQRTTNVFLCLRTMIGLSRADIVLPSKITLHWHGRSIMVKICYHFLL